MAACDLCLQGLKEAMKKKGTDGSAPNCAEE
jgi:hypothetical protein